MWMLAIVSCETPPPTIELSMSAQRDGGVITITGATDLRDGALLGYELRHKDMNFDPETPIDMLFQEGRMTVADGQYGVTVDIRNFEPGEIEVWVAFQMDFINSEIQQPNRIITQFGERGELLQGPNVTELRENGKRVEVTDYVIW